MPFGLPPSPKCLPLGVEKGAVSFSCQPRYSLPPSSGRYLLTHQSRLPAAAVGSTSDTPAQKVPHLPPVIFSGYRLPGDIPVILSIPPAQTSDLVSSDDPPRYRPQSALAGSIQPRPLAPHALKRKTRTSPPLSRYPLWNPSPLDYISVFSKHPDPPSLWLSLAPLLSVPDVRLARDCRFRSLDFLSPTFLLSPASHPPLLPLPRSTRLFFLTIQGSSLVLFFSRSAARKFGSESASPTSSHPLSTWSW